MIRTIWSVAVNEDETEAKLELKIGTPDFLPVRGEVTVAFRRLWHKRGAKYEEVILRETGVGASELAQRIEGGDKFADVFLAGAAKVAVDGDPAVLDAVASLVAGAFQDDAKIDTHAYILTLLAQMQPADLRILQKLAQMPPELPVAKPGPKRWYDPTLDSSVDHPLPMLGTPSNVLRALADSVEPEVVTGSILRLQGLGLAIEQRLPAMYGPPVMNWTPTALGHRLLDVCGLGLNQT